MLHLSDLRQLRQSRVQSEENTITADRDLLLVDACTQTTFEDIYPTSEISTPSGISLYISISDYNMFDPILSYKQPNYTTNSIFQVSSMRKAMVEQVVKVCTLFISIIYSFIFVCSETPPPPPRLIRTSELRTPAL